ncbi:MAG: sulfatase [Oligoflexia bacterium]|nr:sulfatase [Oligoflexia bacterium]
MGHRKNVLLIGFVLFACLIFFMNATQVPQWRIVTSPGGPVARPNIIFILADDLAARDLPYLDRIQSIMFEEGTKFSTFIIPNAWCCPSRSSILTGLYNHNNRNLDNGSHGGWTEFKTAGFEDSNVAVWLHNSGYRTMLAGKYLNKYNALAGAEGNPPVPKGWDAWYAGLSHYGKFWNFYLAEKDLNEPNTGFARKVYYPKKDPVTRNLIPENYATDVVTRKALDFVKANDNRPFFMYLNPTAPHKLTHGKDEDEDEAEPSADSTIRKCVWKDQSGNTQFCHPLPAPRHEPGQNAQLDAKINSIVYPNPANQSFGFLENDTGSIADKPFWIFTKFINGLPIQIKPFNDAEIEVIQNHLRARVRSMEAVEDMLEQIIQSLTETGQLENTYIFFASDHGLHFGEHRQMLNKGTMYEEAIRVPMFVRGPNVSKKVSIPHMALNHDLAVTFADLAGAVPTHEVDGKSLVPLIFGTAPNFSVRPGQSEWRTRVLLEHWEFAGKNQMKIPTGFGIRTRSYKFMEYTPAWTQDKFYEAYNIQPAQDPHELNNIAESSDPEIKATFEQLKVDLQEFKRCRGSACREAELKALPVSDSQD